MVTVSIDVDEARGVIASLRQYVDKVFEQWNEVSTVCTHALCDTSDLRALSDPLLVVSQSATDLETRVDLAILHNTGSSIDMSTNPRLEYVLSGADTIANVKAQLGADIARQMNGLDAYDHLSREDVVRFEGITAVMERYAEDPAVMNGLFGELGPVGVVSLPIMLKDLASNYQRHSGGHLHEDQHWDAETVMSEKIADLQQRFMNAYGQGLATSSMSDDFARDHPDFAADLATAAAEGHGAGWGLSQVLRFGEYEAGFLTTIGEGLYTWEKDQLGPVWAPQVAEDARTWRLGTDDDGRYFDPFVGLFEAMGRSPEAGADFFNPDGGGAEAQARAQYLIQERTWRADDFNALGEVLDAAATRFHTRSAPIERQEQAAWIASATVHYLAQRDGKFKIGDAAKDSLGHLLATYITDVDRAANGSQGGLGVWFVADSSPWLADLPVGANFGVDELRVVLGETMTNDQAIDAVAGATNAWNAERIEYSARTWSGDTTDAGTLRVAVNEASALSGFTVGAMGAGLENEAKDLDDKAKRYIDLTSDVVGLVPTGGTFASFLANQALSAGKDDVTEAWTSNESRLKDDNRKTREVAIADLEIAVAAALAEHGHVTPEGMTHTDPKDPDRERQVYYAWFSSAGFDGSVLTEAKTRDEFIAWAGSVDAPDVLSQLGPNMLTTFEDGHKKGSGS